MCERDRPSRVRDRDLPCVVVTGEDQVECVIRRPSNDAREVAQQKPEARGRVSQPPRIRCPRLVARRIDADNLDPDAARGEFVGSVTEEDGLAEIVELCRTRERVLRDGDVVVAEHDVWPPELAEKLTQ